MTTKHIATVSFHIELTVESEEYDAAVDAINEMDYEFKLPSGATLIRSEMNEISTQPLVIPE